MKLNAAMLFLLTLNLIVQILVLAQKSEAQKAVPANRYTLSTYGGESSGAYVLDNTSGRVWRTVYFTDAGEQGMMLVRTREELVRALESKKN